MSNIYELVLSAVSSELTTNSIDVYSCELNDAPFGGTAGIYLDGDGDCKVSLSISEKDLCDYISLDVMKEYLTTTGYLEGDQ